MSFPRRELRTKKGCTSCRSRRKKCDESRPACKNCERLHLSCVYLLPKQRQRRESITRDNEESSQQQSAQVPDLPSLALPPAIRPEGRRFRTADFTDPSTSPHEYRTSDFLLVLRETDANYESRPSLQQRALEQFVVLGGRYQWQKMRMANAYPALEEAQRVQFASMDEFYRNAGHGPVTRMVFFWHFYALSQHLFGTADSEHKLVVPSWYLPRAGQPVITDAIGLNYIAWPAVRERVQQRPSAYYHPRFYGAIVRSIRFIWPFSPRDATAQTDNLGGPGFSPELRMRAQNIRSFALQKDFLDLYPEFRGEAPQFEPSLTFHRMETADQLEELYWALVYKSRQKRLLLARSAPSPEVRDR